ncbi:NTP transferase domain-containing protein [Candidatus Bathyarchaeota archaeon]|nr:NTP transferase domain-containing protein [Candidatus Bathyarchaeota archaeon]
MIDPAIPTFFIVLCITTSADDTIQLSDFRDNLSFPPPIMTYYSSSQYTVIPDFAIFHIVQSLNNSQEESNFKDRRTIVLQETGIILAGGASTRFGQDKAFLQLNNKPLLRHVLDAIENIVEEIIIVVSSEAQGSMTSRTLASDARIVIDHGNIGGPLIGASTGFKEALGEYSLVLSCDTPFISKDVLLFLLESRIEKDAVIPLWPNGYFEPLQAVYRTRPAFRAALQALKAGESDIRSMIERLQKVHYVSTTILKLLDPNLRTFFNVNTPQDLDRAESLHKS